ncbi:MAG: hypothetical protein IT454_12310 [Planctomycetes bacterium]|nr:hypothetical protein [Planctomycetota bacterium]
MLACSSRFALLAVVALAMRAPAQTSEWSPLTPLRATSEQGATLEIVEEHEVLARDAAPARDVYTLEFDLGSQPVTGLRLDVLVDPSSGGAGPGRSTNGNFVLSELELRSLEGKRPLDVRFGHGEASFEQAGHGLAAAFDGALESGWAVHPQTRSEHCAVFELERDLRGRATITMRFAFGEQHTLQRLRWSATSAARPVRLRGEREGWSELQERINLAIDRAVDHLLDRQELDGSWSHAIGEYRNGQTALCVYALLKSKVPPAHPAIQRALAFLRCELPDKTYAAGLEALALSALGPSADEERIERIAEFLIDAQKGGFAYPDGDADISNSQYGALGMWVAAKHGAAVPLKAWQNLAEFALAQQERPSKGEPEAGFLYRAGFPVTGSRTVGGLTILAICEEQLPESDPLRKACGAARERGLAWLARHFSAASDPLADSQEWVYYWLYGCERVGALLHRSTFGSHDWYREGARFLVDAQKPEGDWSSQPNTCFALLFLNRATAPSSGGGPAPGARAWGADLASRDVSLRAAGDTPLNVWISSFGERALRELRWPQDPEGSLRVLRVDYLLPDRPLVADARSTAVEWKVAPKAPGANWINADFDDRGWRPARGAFGPERGTLSASVWTGGELWLRTAFELAEGAALDPSFVLRFTAPATARVAASEPLVCLFDERREFAAELSDSDRGSRISVGGDAYHGTLALDVTPLQRHRAVLPGWSFEIAKKPAAGQYRYLQFAWRKRDGDGVMLQLSRNGRWEGPTFRYVAGRNPTDWAAEVLDESLPDKWTVVTRDLYEDLGEGARVTGLALTCFGGSQASFDALYLARTKNDFAAIERRGIELERAAAPDRARDAVASGEIVEAWVNGVLALTKVGADSDYEKLAPEIDLRDALRAGRNVLAVHVRGAAGTSFDLGLVDELPIASVNGTPDSAVRNERFAARFPLPRPGTYVLRARVRVAAPPDGRDALGWRDLYSEPLPVTIREAFDQEWLTYASDGARNLLREAELSIKCSSELAGWPAQRACDGTLALGWISNDRDAEPWIQIALAKAVRANTLAFTHPQLARIDAERSGRIRRVSVRFNGQDPPYSVELAPGDARKTTWSAPGVVVVKSLEVRVLERAGVRGSKDGVGLAEIELRLER